MKLIFVRSMIASVALILTLTACKTMDINNVTQLMDSGKKLWDASNITPEQEVQFGENMSATLLGTRPLHPDQQLQKYVNKVGGWLANHSERPHLQWHFGVIKTDGINAFAAPGGFVFVTEGMINLLESESELAAVLAHEIIHVTEKHHLEAMKSGALRGAITESAFVAADNYQSSNRAAQVMDNEWVQNAVRAAGGLYAKGLDRDDEFESDKKGVRLLAKAGYDAYAYVSILQKLSAFAADSDELQLLFKSHPKPKERLSQVANDMAQYDNQKYAAVLQQRFMRNVN